MTQVNIKSSGSMSQRESSMTQSPRVRWPDDRADLAGSPRNLQKRLAACQAGSERQQEPSQRTMRPTPTVSSGETANQDGRNIPAETPSPRSSRTLWADEWQR